MPSYSAQQLAYAQTIAGVGKSMGMTTRDIETAITVALDESGLQNYANSTVPESLSIAHDAIGKDGRSVGLFQQQVGIWGTAPDLMNPENSARLFFQRLQTVKNRNSMPIPVVAQTVQESAFSDGSNYAAQLTNAQEVMGMISNSGATVSDAVKASAPSASAFGMITTRQGWIRIGMFILGGALLWITFADLIASNGTIQTIAKDAVKVAL
jgi:hypothetical protein